MHEATKRNLRARPRDCVICEPCLFSLKFGAVAVKLEALILSAILSNCIAQEASPGIKAGPENKVEYRRLFGEEFEKAASAYKMNETESSLLTPHQLRVFHAQNEINFVQMQEDFGFARMRRLPSEFAYFLKRETEPGKIVKNGLVPPSIELTGDIYLLKRRELIGLLLRSRPTVYESPNIISSNGWSSMKMPADTKSREPDAVETAALEGMKKGNDITVHEETNLVRIIGSLRARKECINCHDCKENDLLGAFSYRLEHVTENELKTFEQMERPKKTFREEKADARTTILKNADTHFIRTLKAHNGDINFQN
jgi:hypothetical protein